MFEDANPFPGTQAIPDRRKTYRRHEDRRLFRRERQLEAARLISQAMFQHLVTDELVKKALHTALEVVGAESGSVLLAEPEAKQLVFRHSIVEKPVQPGTAIPWDQGIAGAVFHSGEPVIIGDAKQDARHFPGIDRMTNYVTRDMIALPLKRWEGEPIGVLEVLNKRDGRMDEDDLSILTIVSAIAATTIEQARLFQEAKLAEVVRLLGNIGHDLKNLLQPVISGTELLKSELDDIFSELPQALAAQKQDSKTFCGDTIGMVQKASLRIYDRGKEIADCVKGLSAPPQFAPCRVADVVESVLQTLRVLAGEKHISLRTEGLESLPSIQADERRLYNAFYNLVNNAIPEVPPGGSITISGSVEPDSQHLRLAVADTGRGMPPEIRERLFTSRTVSTKKEGTGLGDQNCQGRGGGPRGSDYGGQRRWRRYDVCYSPSLRSYETRVYLALKYLCLPDDKGYWYRIEHYIERHSEAEVSHGLCRECARNLYPEYYKDVK